MHAVAFALRIQPPRLQSLITHSINFAGIPISLALVYMAVAARVGLTMEPVNLPAHLMLRPVVTRRGAGDTSGDTGGTSDTPSGGAAAGAGGGRAAAAEEEEDEEEESLGLFVDAFHGGELRWLNDAEAQLSSITGYQVCACVVRGEGCVDYLGTHAT